MENIHEKRYLECQVEGCNENLSSLRIYHRRYKICMNHQKAPTVIIHGKHCRFCQQCGRFHDLSEFQGPRRSCRNRLERHNKRRRIGSVLERQLEAMDNAEESSPPGIPDEASETPLPAAKHSDDSGLFVRRPFDFPSNLAGSHCSSVREDTAQQLTVNLTVKVSHHEQGECFLHICLDFRLAGAVWRGKS